MSGYYAVLGVPVTATNEEVRSAYRRLALLHHPDHGGSVETFYVVREAHHVLSDAGRRAEYDRDLALRRVRRQDQRRDESLTRERDRREAARERATTQEYFTAPPGWEMDGRLVAQRTGCEGRRSAPTAAATRVQTAFELAISMLWGVTAAMLLILVLAVCASLFLA